MTTTRSNGILRKKKPFKVVICLVTLVVFLFNTVFYDLAWAVGTPSELPGGGFDRAGGSHPDILYVYSFALPDPGYVDRLRIKTDFDLMVREYTFLKYLCAPEPVTTVDYRNLIRKLSQEERVLERGISAPDHRYFLPFKKRSVACGAV